MEKHDRALVWVGAALVPVAAVAAFVSAGQSKAPSAAVPTSSTSSVAPSSASTTHATAAPAKARHTPAHLSAEDRALVKFRAFAASGDPTQLSVFATASKGLPSCPDLNVYATVSPSVTGSALAHDMAALFVQRGLLGSSCPFAGLYVFHSPSENNGGGYTAGAVMFDASPFQGLSVVSGPVGSPSIDFR